MKEIDELDLTEPLALNEKMKESLARAYADEGFTLYLQNRIKKANLSLVDLLDKGDAEGAKRLANRIGAWGEILSKGRAYYINFEKIRKKDA